MDRAGIKRQPRTHGFHIFRHSAGSLVNALTGDLKLVQQLLAHARIATTADTYVHVPEGARKATETLADSVLPSCPLLAHRRGRQWVDKLKMRLKYHYKPEV
jgi:integrase